MTTENFEEVGRDMIRTILVYTGLYIPPELEHIYGKQEEGKPIDVSAMLAKELLENKSLMEAGDEDYSAGSESEPSEDNLPIEEVANLIPIVEKS